MNADILMDRDGKSRGLGEVQFEDSNDAIGAIGELSVENAVCGDAI